jgi:hypothetical protein
MGIGFVFVPNHDKLQVRMIADKAITILAPEFTMRRQMRRGRRKEEEGLKEGKEQEEEEAQSEQVRWNGGRISPWVFFFSSFGRSPIDK